MINLTSEQVWKEVEKNLFAVLGMVTAKGEARTVGIVYVVRDGKLYIGTDKDTWKARHVARNPHVSLTVAIPKHIPFMPWIKVPAATITFAGEARVVAPGELDTAVVRAVFRDMAANPTALADACIIVVEPVGEFVTYGVGVPLMQMRFPGKARGRAPVKA